MKKFIVGMFLIQTVLLLVGCQEEYDSSIHEQQIKEIQSQVFVYLSDKVENPIYIEKMESKNEYEDYGKINDYRIRIHIKDKDELNGEGYTKHEWWDIAHRVDEVVSNNRLVGEGTPSEGAYNAVYFNFGDEIESFSLLKLNYFGDSEKTYQEFMTDYYDGNGKPVFDGSYKEESEDEWIHQF